MRFITISFTLLGALIFEWAWGARFSLLGVAPPIFVLVLSFWFWHLSFVERLEFAGGAGFVLDSISLHPLGTHLLLYLVLALLMEALHTLFSSRDSVLSIGVASAVSILLFSLLAPPLGFAIASMQGKAVPFAASSRLTVWAAVFAWSLILPVFFLLARHGFAALQRRLDAWWK